MYEKINMSNFIQNYVQNVQQHTNKVYLQKTCLTLAHNLYV